MLRVGAQSEKMRPLSSDDIFLARLKLLVIMIKALLKGFPLGECRKSAFLDNAQKLFYGVLVRMGAPSADTQAPPVAPDLREHIFLQRVQLLAVMARSCVQTGEIDGSRRQAVADNLDSICEYLADLVQINDIHFLKVA